ncbi:hypothetical protein EDEG_00200 [Edhazardia aedis USNM 41457]|uniref:Uncharacterized protein n=1 Tax=Edhazardia aedis (strain USNM 41457) TaxID=1003232 RepID=J8ZV19_EDHAE|nr:hypothetical protein EDEG_00200 [Edhazardia aedis USNM 41457]|eukprot:EJW03518.1 hypothetical protein EDEG_00200 [Edhazardia aedis USNM 41457]
MHFKILLLPMLRKNILGFCIKISILKNNKVINVIVGHPIKIYVLNIFPLNFLNSQTPMQNAIKNKEHQGREMEKFYINKPLTGPVLVTYINLNSEKIINFIYLLNPISIREIRQ